MSKKQIEKLTKALEMIISKDKYVLFNNDANRILAYVEGIAYEALGIREVDIKSPTPVKLSWGNRDFEKASHCRLCGKAMMHTRLYGYQCSNPEHREILNNIYEKAQWDDETIERMIQDEQRKRGYID